MWDTTKWSRGDLFKHPGSSQVVGTLLKDTTTFRDGKTFNQQLSSPKLTPTTEPQPP